MSLSPTQLTQLAKDRAKVLSYSRTAARTILEKRLLALIDQLMAELQAATPPPVPPPTPPPTPVPPPPPPSTTGIVTDPASLVWTQTSGVHADPTLMTVTTSNGARFSTDGGAEFFSGPIACYAPAGGSCPSGAVLEFKPRDMPPGTYTGAFTIASPGLPTITVPVTLTVTPSGSPVPSPTPPSPTPPPPVPPIIVRPPPIARPAPGAPPVGDEPTPDITVNFNNYTTSTEMKADSATFEVAEILGGTQIELESNGGIGGSKNLLYNYPVRDPGCADYTIRLPILSGADQQEITWRWWAKFPSDWTNDAGCPLGVELKFWFGGSSAGSRAELLSQSSNGVAGGWPGNEVAWPDTLGFLGLPAPMWDGAYHSYAVAMRASTTASSADGYMYFFMDDVMMSNGVATGINMNPGGNTTRLRGWSQANLNQGPLIAQSLRFDNIQCWLGSNAVAMKDYLLSIQ